jgi:arylamine N-acetyltransferase
VAEAWVDRYLGLLGLPWGPPDRAMLDSLIRAHRAIAFESVSSLLRRRAAGSGPVPALDLDQLLDRWTARRGGGVCYEVGSMLGRLLETLGYAVQPVLARISFPGSHSALFVDLDGRRLIVDVGNGQPIFEAIAVDEPFEIDRAGLRYRFRPDPETGKLIQDRWVGGAFTPFVTYETRPATIDEVEAAYQRHHTLPPSTFVMQNFRLVLCAEDVVLQLRDDELTRHTAAGRTSGTRSWLALPALERRHWSRASPSRSPAEPARPPSSAAGSSPSAWDSCHPTPAIEATSRHA